MKAGSSLVGQERRQNRLGAHPAGPLALAIALSVLLMSAGCSPPKATTAEQAAPVKKAQPVAPPDEPTAAPVTELKIKDIKVGTGAVAKSGDLVTVNYTGWLTDGTKFDSSLDRNEPFKFPLGQGQVIAGWDQGVAGMKVGGKRKLTIPAELGYGAQGAGGGKIPPGATLVFDVELLAVN
jgi:FKBP-type peptidyl-prolyl cis-trans isomerase FkpA